MLQEAHVTDFCTLVHIVRNVTMPPCVRVSSQSAFAEAQAARLVLS